MTNVLFFFFLIHKRIKSSYKILLIALTNFPAGPKAGLS